MPLAPYAGSTAYFGDIHNHCSISYGKGTLEEALRNAREHLDFTSVTVHGHWPDIPTDDPRLGYLVDYHERGFKTATERWRYYHETIDAANHDGRFVTFPSFEWHSMRYGDHCVYFKEGAPSRIFAVNELEDIRRELRALASQGHDTLLIPHHIGYLSGYRGIHWPSFTTEFSPVAEILSFHGLSESDEAPFPYLHSMGPRDERSTVQYGLAAGHIFGFIGSTDHHSAHPGTYGYGKAAVWAASLSRDAIWEAIKARRTYALSGDRIVLEFALNEQPMGAVLPHTPERWIETAVSGGAALDYIEILHNNQVIHRENIFSGAPDFTQPVKVLFECGWGEEQGATDWRIDLRVTGGRLLAVEPRLRGHDVGVPLNDDDACAFSHWAQPARDGVQLRTRSWRNPTVACSGTQALCLEIEGDATTRIVGSVNHIMVDLPLAELATGPRSRYLSGFVSPSFCFHRAVPRAEYSRRFALAHRSHSQNRDWYYARVRQKNGQWAWSSPIWV